MEYINHVTLQTGHSRKTYPNEVNKELYFILHALYKDSLKRYVDVLDNYIMKSTTEQMGTFITLFKKGNVPLSILTMCISKSDHFGLAWKTLHESAMLPVKTNPNKPPKLPYIADRLEIGALQCLDAMQWTGDFSRCMRWIVLDPKQIR